ncbi:MAG TPA: hypothetical protein PK001_04455, partial [Dokdonella sp.]|uniref:hypothetical protein n=1 Tax=Dokdonella sp. TaxID=2291710 RepID=UPI002B939663
IKLDASAARTDVAVRLVRKIGKRMSARAFKQGAERITGHGTNLLYRRDDMRVARAEPVKSISRSRLRKKA